MIMASSPSTSSVLGLGELSSSARPRSSSLEQLVEVAELGEAGLVGRQQRPTCPDQRDDLVGRDPATWPPERLVGPEPRLAADADELGLAAHRGRSCPRSHRRWSSACPSRSSGRPMVSVALRAGASPAPASPWSLASTIVLDRLVGEAAVAAVVTALVAAVASPAGREQGEHAHRAHGCPDPHWFLPCPVRWEHQTTVGSAALRRRTRSRGAAARCLVGLAEAVLLPPAPHRAGRPPVPVGRAASSSRAPAAPGRRWRR